MKDVYCINILNKPIITIYELYVKFSLLFSIKLTHYCGTTSEGKTFAGRLGEKGLQKIQNMRHEDNKDMELYDLVSSASKNHLIDMSNLISCSHCQDGYQFLIIVEEKYEGTIDLETLMTVFIDEEVANAYCFKYERELLPETVFLGIFANPIGVAKKRTKAEGHLVSIFSKIRHEDPMLIPQILPKMYLSIADDKELEKACEEEGYKIERSGKGSIISTGDDMRVPICEKENKLLRFLEKIGFAKTYDLTNK